MLQPARRKYRKEQKGRNKGIDIAGAEGKLPYTREVHDYMRLLAKSTPRAKVFTIGTSEEGREMVAVAIASEALMARLEENKADLAKVADPRTLKMDDAAADVIARRAAPVYYITGTIHSTEAGAPTALMELAYRLAVDESPYVRNIREHGIAYEKAESVPGFGCIAVPIGPVGSTVGAGHRTGPGASRSATPQRKRSSPRWPKEPPATSIGPWPLPGLHFPRGPPSAVRRAAPTSRRSPPSRTSVPRT